ARPGHELEEHALRHAPGAAEQLPPPRATRGEDHLLTPATTFNGAAFSASRHLVRSLFEPAECLVFRRCSRPPMPEPWVDSVPSPSRPARQPLSRPRRKPLHRIQDPSALAICTPGRFFRGMKVGPSRRSGYDVRPVQVSDAGISIHLA